MTPRVVAAYGGSLDSAAAAAALAARLGVEIATLTLDLGQGVDLQQVRERALSAGAARAHVVDARQELAADVIRPALVAGAFDRSAHARAITRPVIARHLVAVARMEGASAVAHGASGDDRVCLDRLVADLAPDLAIHALEEEGLARADDTGITQHLWARTVAMPGGEHEPLPPGTYSRTSAPAALGSQSARVDLSLDRGVPVAVNGVPIDLDALIEVVDTIAGDHGVGRAESRADGVLHLIEAPAAVVLGAAVRALAGTTLAPDLVALRDQTAAAYSALVVEGRWHTPTRTALDAFSTACAGALTGTVTLELARGECRILDRAATPAAEPAYS